MSPFKNVTFDLTGNAQNVSVTFVKLMVKYSKITDIFSAVFICRTKYGGFVAHIVATCCMNGVKIHPMQNNIVLTCLYSYIQMASKYFLTNVILYENFSEK